MRYLVKFKNVGREKRCWEKETETLDEIKLSKEAKKNGAIKSNSVDVVLSENLESGIVIVGGWRTVGELEIVDRGMKMLAA